MVASRQRSQHIIPVGQKKKGFPISHTSSLYDSLKRSDSQAYTNFFMFILRDFILGDKQDKSHSSPRIEFRAILGIFTYIIKYFFQKVNSPLL